MKKTLVITAIVIALSLVLPFAAFASPDIWEYPVVDNADILTENEENQLVNKLLGLVKEHKMHFVIVTEATIGSKTPYSYADAYYHDNSLGYGEEKSGILLLLVMDERDYYIYTYGEAEDKFGDSELTDLEDAMLPYLGENQYYDGFMAYADACDKALSFDILANLLIAVVIGAIISLIIVFSMKSKLKSVRPQRAASNYVRNGSFNVTKHLDLYLYSTVTKTRRADTNSGGRSSGGGSRGGGRGGKF